MITNFIQLDFNKENDLKVPSVQYDSGSRFVKIKLQRNKSPFEIDGYRVTVVANKVDGTEIMNDCTILDGVNGVVQFEITEQFNAVEGVVDCQLKLFKGKTLLTSMPFSINVVKSVSTKEIVSSNELKTLVNALGEVQNIDNRFAQTNAQLSADKKELTAQLDRFNSEKANKADVYSVQQQVNNLVLGAVGNGNNAEVVQARGDYPLLNARLDTYDNDLQNIKCNTLHNYAEDCEAESYGNVFSNIRKSGNIVTFDSTGGTECGIKLNFPLKPREEYLVSYEVLSEHDIQFNTISPMYSGVWTGKSAEVTDRNVQRVTGGENGGELVFRANKITSGTNIKVAFFIYNHQNNPTIEDNIYKNFKNPKMNTQSLSVLGDDVSLLSFDKPNYIYKERVTVNYPNKSGYKILPNSPILRVNEQYYMIAHLVNKDKVPYNSLSVTFRSIVTHTYDNKINATGVKYVTDEIYFGSLVKSTDSDVFEMTVGWSGAEPNTDYIFDIYLFKANSESQIKALKQNNSFLKKSMLENVPLSTFNKDLSLMDLKNIKPLASAIKEYTFTSSSSYFATNINSFPLEEDLKYTVVVKLSKGSTISHMDFRSLTSGSWDNVVNASLTKIEIDGVVYFHGSFTVNQTIEKDLYFNVGGLVSEQEYVFETSIYDSSKDILNSLFKNPEFIANPTATKTFSLSEFTNDLDFSDFNTIEPITTNSITRSETSKSSWFRSTIPLDLKANRRYLYVVNLTACQQMGTGTMIRTIDGGAWDFIVNEVLIKKITDNSVYFETVFTPTKDCTRELCLNPTELQAGETYKYDIYVFDVTDFPVQMALKPNNAFMKPNLLDSISYGISQFDGKVISALGDSLTALGSGGHYITFTKNQLGFLRANQCGVGGSRVSGTGEQCFWQDLRVNTLPLDSDFITIMGGTNDAPQVYNQVSDSDFTLDNCDTNNFVGAYNVLLSKIYYKFLKLDSGFYSSVDYSGVTQCNVPKDIKLLLITPPKVLNSTENHSRFVVAEYVRKIGKMWGIPVVDANGEMQMNHFNYPKDISDKVHFPLQFHENLAKLIVGKLKEVESF